MKEKRWYIIALNRLDNEDMNYVYGVYDTKKQAEKKVKELKWCDAWLDKEKRFLDNNYVIVEEDELF